MHTSYVFEPFLERALIDQIPIIGIELFFKIEMKINTWYQTKVVYVIKD